MIRVVAASRLYSDRIEDYYAAVKELIEKTRQEEGCIYYTLNRDEKDPQLHYLSEGWKDRAALDSHLQSGHFRRIVPSLSEFIEERPMPMMVMEEVEL